MKNKYLYIILVLVLVTISFFGFYNISSADTTITCIISNTCGTAPLCEGTNTQYESCTGPNPRCIGSGSVWCPDGVTGYYCESYSCDPGTCSAVSVSGVQGWNSVDGWHTGDIYTIDTILAIYGTNFSVGGNSVLVDGSPVSISYNNNPDVNPDQINVTISPLTAGGHDVEVTNNCGNKSPVRDFIVVVKPVTTYTLSVSKGGTGTGIVTGPVGTGDGINCGVSNCSEVYNSGTSVTLSASANSDSTFTGWSGDCNSSGQVTMTANKSCTATFRINPTGTLTATNCNISAGASSCNTNLVWSTTNPIPGYTSAVTTPTGITVLTANSSAGTPYTVAYGSRNFYLYHNAVELDSATANASCVAGTGWYDGLCRLPINGGWTPWSPTTSCPTACGFPASTLTRTCTNPIPQYGGADCSGSSTMSCAATAPCPTAPPIPTGLSVVPSTCGNNWLNISWNASSGATSYQVYRDGGGTPIYNSSGTSFSDTGLALGSSHSYTVRATNTTGSSVQSSPVSNTVASACPVMSGTLTATNCTIALNASSCNTTLTWSITNPVAIPTAITASGMTNINVTNTLATPQSGTQSASVPYPSRTFYLYNNAVLLNQKTATASCISGTSWDGSKCAAGAVPITVTTNPTGINITVDGISYASPQTFNWIPGSTHTIAAAGYDTATTRYTFTSWSDLGAVTHTITTPAVGTTYTANFSLKYMFTLLVDPVSGGSVTPATGYYSGWIGISATPNAGYQFSGWTGDTTSSNNPEATYVNQPRTVTAHFNPILTMSGTLTASNCTIASGASSCNSSLTWSTTNPVSTSAVTTPTSVTVATGNSGSTTYSVAGGSPSGSRTFYLYNNAVLLDQKTATATCTAGTSWDGSKCSNVIPANDAQCVSINAPSPVSTGQTFSATVVMKNTGTNTWSEASWYRLGSQNTQDNTRWGFGRVYLPAGVTVVKDSNYSFVFNATAPATPGTYPFDWKMVRDGVEWFGGTCTKTITVSTPVSATVDINANPTAIPYNSASTLSWSYSNASSCTITAPGSISGYPSGSGSVSTGNLTADRNYTISCLPGPMSDTVLVDVAAQPKTINVIKSGQGTVVSSPAGISCGSGCSSQTVEFAPNISIILTATPATGRIFTGWGGACSGKALSCTVVTDGDKMIIANFIVDPNWKEF